MLLHRNKRPSSGVEGGGGDVVVVMTAVVGMMIGYRCGGDDVVDSGGDDVGGGVVEMKMMTAATAEIWPKNDDGAENSKEGGVCVLGARWGLSIPDRCIHKPRDQDTATGRFNDNQGDLSGREGIHDLKSCSNTNRALVKNSHVNAFVVEINKFT
ncbi:hypothetical protein Tco_1314675 [Tanacetum coccineum]